MLNLSVDGPNDDISSYAVVSSDSASLASVCSSQPLHCCRYIRIGLCLLKFGIHKPTSTSPTVPVYPRLNILMMTILFLVSLIVSIHIVPFHLMIPMQHCCHPNMILFYKMMSMGSSILTLLTILTLVWTSILVIMSMLEISYALIMILFPSTEIRIIFCSYPWGAYLWAHIRC